MMDLEILKWLKDYKFISKVNLYYCVEFINEDNLKHNNYKIFKGSWGHPAVSDIELSKLYSSKVTIIL